MKRSIEVTLAQPATSITLNAIEIKFGTVTVSAAGKEQTATVTTDDKLEQATFTVPQTIPAGKATVKISYDGILNDQLRGFYLSKTPKRNYAVTQFEPTDARRAFPSFDEPAMKAKYNVTLVVDKGDTAISNTNIISDKPGPGADKHTVTFATTPKMSTYLVAFLVGDFQCLSGSERWHPDSCLRDSGQGAAGQICADGRGVLSALLRHIFRHQVSDAEAGHDCDSGL